jgi:hypothetical protein
MVSFSVNFVEVIFDVVLTVFFTMLFNHMLITKKIIEDIQRREELRQLTEKKGGNKDEF